jgi:hypothetical protein
MGWRLMTDEELLQQTTSQRWNIMCAAVSATFASGVVSYFVVYGQS